MCYKDPRKYTNMVDRNRIRHKEPVNCHVCIILVLPCEVKTEVIERDNLTKDRYLCESCWRKIEYIKDMKIDLKRGYSDHIQSPKYTVEEILNNEF